MGLFFTSDQHFGHANIIRYCLRPFSNLAEMHAAIIDRYNARVGDDDLVYHLGDFALDERLVPVILKQLKGRKVLVCGNHDRCYPGHKHHEAATRRYLMYGFDSVTTSLELPISIDAGNRPGESRYAYGQYVTLCHLPYRGDSHDNVDRFQQFRMKDEGQWLLHGHVHEMWRVRDRMVNVGVDQWDFAPVSEDEVAAIIR